MSSIMRARSGLTRRSERWEGIGGSSLELKVAGPSMLGIGCPDRHALLLMPFPSAAAERTHPEAAPSRESGFVPCPIAVIARPDLGPSNQSCGRRTIAVRQLLDNLVGA